MIWFLESWLKGTISFEFLFILKFVTKKLHAQCACRLENLLAQRKKCMHLCKCACVKSSTVSGPIPGTRGWGTAVGYSRLCIVHWWGKWLCNPNPVVCIATSFQYSWYYHWLLLMWSWWLSLCQCLPVINGYSCIILVKTLGTDVASLLVPSTCIC